MRILVVAEHDGVALRSASLACLSFARTVAEGTGDGVQWLVMGDDVAQIEHVAARYAPVISVKHPVLQAPLAEPMSRIIAEVVRLHQFDLVASASSTFAKDILPRTAALLGGAMVSEVTRHEWRDGELLFDSPQFAGAVTATIRLHGSPRVATVRASSYPVAMQGKGDSIEHVSLDETCFDGRVQYEGLQSKPSSRPDVSEAQIVVSGGRAIRNSNDFEQLVGGLADVLGGAAGSSRALVDAGITPNELQVGQTGKIVAPQVYIAVGISGAVQHLAGMKNSRTIIAINKDPDAPIFDVADVGLVGDVYAVVPELISKLKNHAATAAR